MTVTYDYDYSSNNMDQLDWLTSSASIGNMMQHQQQQPTHYYAHSQQSVDQQYGFSSYAVARQQENFNVPYITNRPTAPINSVDSSSTKFENRSADDDDSPMLRALLSNKSRKNLSPFGSKNGDAATCKEKRSKRQTYTRQQILELENEFRTYRYLTRQRRIEISSILELSERQIKVWFQNRRMKAKKDPMMSPTSEYNHSQLPVPPHYIGNITVMPAPHHQTTPTMSLYTQTQYTHPYVRTRITIKLIFVTTEN